VSGAIEPAGRMALVRLPQALEAGDEVQIETTRTGGVAGFEPVHRLRRPDGTTVGNVNRFGIWTWTVDSPGENTVQIVAADENSEGTYAFRWMWAGGQCPGFPDDDIDDDGVVNDEDNCPDDSNPDQADADGDLVGDVCDTCEFDPANDADGDGVCGDLDSCPVAPNASQEDFDGDGQGDVCDACPFDSTNMCEPPPPSSAVCAEAQNELAGKYWKAALKCGSKLAKHGKDAKFQKCTSKALSKLEAGFPDTVSDPECPVQSATVLAAAVIDRIIILMDGITWDLTDLVSVKHERRLMGKLMQLSGKAGESVMSGKGTLAQCPKKFTRLIGKAQKKGITYDGHDVCVESTEAAQAIDALVSGM
jgi:hypothetical protein